MFRLLIQWPSWSSSAYFTPINPPGISCPNDAPQVRVSSIGNRMDIEFSEVSGAYKYQIEIERYEANGNETEYLLEVPAPAHRYEWYTTPGSYLVKVRTLNCDGAGNWSERVWHCIDDPTPKPTSPSVNPPETPPEPPQAPPTCTLTQTFAVQGAIFDFEDHGPIRGWLNSAEVTVMFSNAATWELELVASNSDPQSNTSIERAAGGTVKDTQTVALVCGQSSTKIVRETNDSWKYWWYRIPKNGVVVYTSQRYQYDAPR